MLKIRSRVGSDKEEMKEEKPIFGYELRFSISMCGILGLLTGFSDAFLGENWTLKAFVWSAWFFLALLVIIFELTHYETPEQPFLESLILSISLMCSLWSIHGAVWSISWMSLGNVISDPLWLSPNIYLQRNLFFASVIIGLIIYVVIQVVVNIHNRDVYVPKKVLKIFPKY